MSPSSSSSSPPSSSAKSSATSSSLPIPGVQLENLRGSSPSGVGCETIRGRAGGSGGAGASHGVKSAESRAAGLSDDAAARSLSVGSDSSSSGSGRGDSGGGADQSEPKMLVGRQPGACAGVEVVLPSFERDLSESVRVSDEGGSMDVRRAE
mgnify:CR=1 FL=1